MNRASAADDRRRWLATTVQSLLAGKYGAEGVPGTRRIVADIAAANEGTTISHARLHDILTGAADNLTDRTRMLLARFFDREPAYFFPPAPPPDGAGRDGHETARRLAARFASMDPAQLAAIKQALDIIDNAAE